MDQASRLRTLVKIKAAQAAFPEAPATSAITSKAPRVIAVTSGKGGVGKTNIVGNMAVAAAKMGKKVMVLDADLGLANIDIIFGIHPEYNIGHVLSGEKKLSEIMVQTPSGIRIIPAGSGFINLTRLTDGEKLSLLAEFDALEETPDLFLIDTGAGISANVIYFNLAAEECIIVATPEPTSVTDAYAMMKVMSTRHGARHFKLLINMVADATEAKHVFVNLSQAADRFLNGIVMEYVGYIPMDARVREAVRKQKTVLELFPLCDFSKQIKAIAAELFDGPRRMDAEGNIKFFFNRFMEYRTEAAPVG